jgi:hypothetical protein
MYLGKAISVSIRNAVFLRASLRSFKDNTCGQAYALRDSFYARYARTAQNTKRVLCPVFSSHSG